MTIAPQDALLIIYNQAKTITMQTELIEQLQNKVSQLQKASEKVSEE